MKSAVLVFCAALAASGPAASAVDVNMASAEPLQTVRGIGPAIAARIVAARETGAFRDADDLRDRVRGFGPVTVRRLLGAGLQVPSVSIRPASPVGPEVIVGRPAARSPGPVPVCPATLRTAAPDGVAARAAHPRRQRRPAAA